MFNIRAIVLAVGMFGGLWASQGTAEAGTYSQYSYSVQRGYGYRTYSYYSATYQTTRYHVAVYRPSQPKYVYFYNSHTKKYWGRYNVTTGKYALLADDKKKEALSEIAETDFQAEGQMPNEGEGSDDSLLPPPEAPAQNRDQAPAPKASPVAPMAPQAALKPKTYGNCH